MTYGDGLSDINIKTLIKTHIKKNKLATVTAVNPVPRWGELKIKNNLVIKFKEKPSKEGSLINGGFFILEKEIFEFLNLKKNIMWEQEPMIKLAKKNQLAAYIHKGFWYAMDTERDQKYLNKLFKTSPYWLKK